MTFTLLFSHMLEGKRVPLVIDGKEASLQVEADSKSGAIYHPDTVKFCEENSCAPRRVSP